MNKAGNSQERREACGGGRQLPVPEHQRASLFNRHPQMSLTPDHPESTHCQERFRNPPAIHVEGVQGPRLPPEKQPGKSHLTQHQTKRPRMSDSALREDTSQYKSQARPATRPRDRTSPRCAPSRAGLDQRSPSNRGSRHCLPAPIRKRCCMLTCDLHVDMVTLMLT